MPVMPYTTMSFTLTKPKSVIINYNISLDDTTKENNSNPSTIAPTSTTQGSRPYVLYQIFRDGSLTPGQAVIQIPHNNGSSTGPNSGLLGVSFSLTFIESLPARPGTPYTYEVRVRRINSVGLASPSTTQWQDVLSVYTTATYVE